MTHPSLSKSVLLLLLSLALVLSLSESRMVARSYGVSAAADNGEDPTEALRAVIAGNRRPRAPPSPTPNHDPPACCGGTAVCERWGVQKKAQLSVSQSTGKVFLGKGLLDIDQAIVSQDIYSHSL
ncbi:hypothetical protein Taro_007463 [Colocasia esculenta]|uniref:Uncharacterized protein n=1 Tax=Colocasia esculenta TaxID=4460 RepID=A0A843TZ20_COLES|nr:hypothetical protein [Colocasia esculenta]